MADKLNDLKEYSSIKRSVRKFIRDDRHYEKLSNKTSKLLGTLLPAPRTKRKRPTTKRKHKESGIELRVIDGGRKGAMSPLKTTPLHDLIGMAARNARISKIAARSALNSFTANVAKELKKKDGRATLAGFGTFKKVRVKAHRVKSRVVKGSLKGKPAYTIKFKPSKKLKDSI